MVDFPLPLYLTEPELAKHLGIPLPRWKELAPIYQRAGMPLPDPVCGLRYRPAVEAFFNRHNRLARYLADEPIERPGIVENLDAFNTPRGRRRKTTSPSKP